MFSNYTYIIWLIVFIGLPLVALLRWRLFLWKQRRALALATFGSLVGGWAWDVIAVRFGAWYYDPNHIFGLWYFGLPIEEWLWIVGTTLFFGSLTVILAERKVISEE
ncbi:hypothetical protein BH10CHL1_BH10CHL1_32730 [soil metagenome]